jgi:hypothetical protein
VFGDLPTMLQPPIPTQQLLDAHFGGIQESADLYHLRLPRLETTAAYRTATAWMSDRAFEVENQRSGLAEVTRFPNDDAGERLRKITLSLLQRIGQLERKSSQTNNVLNERLNQIEAQTTRVAQLAKYVRANRRKKK